MKKFLACIICIGFAMMLPACLKAQKIKIFVLAGQSNMQGQGDISPGNIPGTLTHFMDEGGDEQFEYIRDSNIDWTTRDDVWVRFDNDDGEFIADELGIGFGANDNQIGPELGFGHLLGEFSDDQVLIIKTCWGGKNLAIDFRPPSSGGAVGPFYNQMISDINTAISNIATEFPDYAGQAIEIAGFCWFQGWNDGEEEAFLNEYEQNLINLIADVRSDLNVPALPFVVGLTGNGGNDLDETDGWVQSLQTVLVPAQISAAEFAGHTNVTYADTRDFWPAANVSPEPDFVHHWRNNGESYLRIGTELGEKMILLLNSDDPDDPGNPGGVFPASGYGFNTFSTEFIANNNFGAGYSFYSAVWPFMEQYPGFENFQTGQGTWVAPEHTGSTPSDFYNTIEGGLGWWGDTRFATNVPKFIMGGVAHSFDAAANGPGAGSTDHRFDGQRDWDSPGGKYGVAQLSQNLLWPPDGLNMAQGSNGEFLGYGYHPLPLTDPMTVTNGVNWETGNQCWTLFMNAANFKGPAAFFIPTFWAASVIGNSSYEGLFLDSRPSTPNLTFAQEFSAAPAIVGVDNIGDVYARILPPVYPRTTANTSTTLRDISVYSKSAKWDEVESWFNGGATPSTALRAAGTIQVDFDIDNSDPIEVNAAVWSDEGPVVDAFLSQSSYSQVKMSADRKSAFLEWDTDVVGEVATGFIMPEFYKLSDANSWENVLAADVPVSSGLLDNEPAITPRNDDLSYITPLEPDSYLFGDNSPWNSPGPVAGPFLVSIGDGSHLTYYWYRFIDQPSIIQANLPEDMRQALQNRVEMIHANWSSSDEYLAPPTGGTLVGIDPGLIVTPPAGLEIGYVPIVTRQGDISPLALPVELIEFNGKREGKNIVLNWTTANEVNNIGFEVQWSANGSNWQAMGFVNSLPAETVPNNYIHVDQDPFVGANYYRLKQVDADETFAYSDVVTIGYQHALASVEVFPNPSKEVFSIDVDNPLKQKVKVSIVDNLGRKVREFDHTESEASWRQEVTLTVSGVYFMSAQIGDQVFYQKIVIED